MPPRTKTKLAPTTEPPHDRSTHVHVRLSPWTARRTRALSSLDGVSVSAVVEAALDAFLHARGVPAVHAGRSR